MYGRNPDKLKKWTKLSIQPAAKTSSIENARGAPIGDFDVGQEVCPVRALQSNSNMQDLISRMLNLKGI
jgi:hypothetical protein